jgi:transcriptional regulator with XRE-family HTH domain
MGGSADALAATSGNVGGGSLAGMLVVEARRYRGLSQRELARRAGVSRTTVAEIEAGTRDPGLNKLRTVLEGVGLDLEVRLLIRDEASSDVLDAEQTRREHGVDRFVRGLADGLAASRPLVDSP